MCEYLNLILSVGKTVNDATMSNIKVLHHTVDIKQTLTNCLLSLDDMTLITLVAKVLSPLNVLMLLL